MSEGYTQNLDANDTVVVHIRGNPNAIRLNHEPDGVSVTASGPGGATAVTVSSVGGADEQGTVTADNPAAPGVSRQETGVPAVSQQETGVTDVSDTESTPETGNEDEV